jgi:CubicO group peptidase (beta-lactamase class C family)
MNKLLMKKSLMFSMTIMLTLVTLLSVIGSALAKENRIAPKMNTSTARSHGKGPTDPTEMEAFMNELLNKQLDENHIAGAAVAVVKDGKLFFTKGYGYADLENKISVDAEQTLFRIGSNTKLFTWTAVMQLVELGKLDLDADINTYLDFHIPDTYPQPITLRHLMSHTAGFEDLHVDMVTLDENEIKPQGAWLAFHIPARIFPPGEITSYSNYGAALAGYIVARVSGESYSQYVQVHIFNPLGMRHSTSQWPAPQDLRANESVGYTYQNGAFQVFPRLYGPIDLLPIGGIETTASDMARFMIAHLQNGRYSDSEVTQARILEEATAQQMHSTLRAPAAGMLGNDYGFFEFNDNGQRVIGHSGEGEPMESMLFLLPDQNIGAFVVYNSMGGSNLNSQHLGFQRAFFDHYYPAPAVEPIRPSGDFAQRADRFTGSYRWTRRSYNTFEKFLALSSPMIDIKNPGDGTLLVVTPWLQFNAVEESPLYFRQLNGPMHIAFREDDQGRIAYLFTDFIPQFDFEKAQWYETVNFNMPLLLASLLLSFSVLPVAMIRAIRNRHQTTPRWVRVATSLIVGISILNLLFVAGNVIWGEQLVFGVSLAYKVTLGLGVLSAVLTVGALVYTVLAWKNGYWSTVFRAYYTLVTIAAVAFIWFLNFWNLLGWRY